MLQQIEFISANVLSETPATKLAAVRTARKLLSRTPLAPIDQLLQCGIVPELVNCLVPDDQSVGWRFMELFVSLIGG